MLCSSQTDWEGLRQLKPPFWAQSKKCLLAPCQRRSPWAWHIGTAWWWKHSDLPILYWISSLESLICCNSLHASGSALANDTWAKPSMELNICQSSSMASFTSTWRNQTIVASQKGVWLVLLVTCWCTSLRMSPVAVAIVTRLHLDANLFHNLVSVLSVNGILHMP